MYSGLRPDAATQLMTRCKSESNLVTPYGISQGDKGIKGLIGTNRLKILKDIYQNISDEEYPSSINLSNNNLKISDLSQFVKSFREKLLYVNLSDNNLGLSGAKSIFNRFSESSFHITNLNLQNCFLGDRGCSMIIDACDKLN